MLCCVRSIFTIIRHSSNHKIICSNTKFNFKRWLPQYYSSQTENHYPNQIETLDSIVKDLCKGDPELEKKLRILMLEVEVMRQDGRYAPDNINKDQWSHILELQSKSQRTNYLRFLFKVEKSKENFKAKKEARRNMKPVVVNPEELKENEDDLLYGIQFQSLFLRIRDKSINQFDNYRALQSMICGQSIVIDCSYESDMVFKETVNAAKQLTFVFGDNRVHKEPFNLHLCNLNMDGLFMKQLRKNIPSLDEPWFPMNMHTKSYLDVFPKDKLVYLTPHCREELTNFDHDAVYIVGCMVDKMNNEPLSLARAKRDGIKMAKLPLDRYLEWAPGSKKNLNINHMVPILLDLKLTADWEFALRHIPRRKLMETKIMAMEKKLQKNPKLMKQLNSFKSGRLNTKSYQTKLNVLSFKEKRLNSSSNTKDKKIKSVIRTLYDDENI